MSDQVIRYITKLLGDCTPEALEAYEKGAASGGMPDCQKGDADE